MTSADVVTSPRRPAPALERRRFTVDEYHRMVAAGVLGPDERVELLDGEVVRVSPMGSPHAACVRRLSRLLGRGAGDRAQVAVQLPLRLDAHSEPEPDVALLRPRDDDYAAAHPGPADALLVVEVGDSSVLADRDVKAPLYAHAGVGELWLVDLRAGTITRLRRPAGDRYEDVAVLGPGATLEPQALPGLTISLDEALAPALRALREPPSQA